MKSLSRKFGNRYSLMDAIRARVSAYLYRLFGEDDGTLSKLDRWTQRRITDENMAKIALVLDLDDPAEACYRDLIREIDTEAETGIYLVRADSKPRHLRRLIDEPGISGELHDEIETIAPIMFPDETARSNDDLDLVWVTINAIHDRAHVDATVSGIVMSFLTDDFDSARDMSDAMRALQYSFHEDVMRRHCNLPLMLNAQDNRELLIMVTELAKRSGSYQDRVSAICAQADTD